MKTSRIHVKITRDNQERIIKIDTHFAKLSGKKRLFLSLVGLALIGYGSSFLLPLTPGKFLIGFLLIICGFICLRVSLSYALVSQTKILATTNHNNGE
jgi:hypothetical protein